MRLKQSRRDYIVPQDTARHRKHVFVFGTALAYASVMRSEKVHSTAQAHAHSVAGRGEPKTRNKHYINMLQTYPFFRILSFDIDFTLATSSAHPNAQHIYLYTHPKRVQHVRRRHLCAKVIHTEKHVPVVVPLL